MTLSKTKKAIKKAALHDPATLLAIKILNLKSFLKLYPELKGLIRNPEFQARKWEIWKEDTKH